MYQPNLPHFDKEYAKVREKDIDISQTMKRLVRFYTNMDKCKDPKVIPLCRKQKKTLQYYFTNEYITSKQRS